MARKTERYHIIRAHAGRRDDEIAETVTIANQKEYRALTDRIFDMNSNLTADERSTKTYYGIAHAATCDYGDLVPRISAVQGVR